MNRAARVLGVAGAASLLGGCVAMAALPVLAGGAMFAGGNVRIRSATPRPKLGSVPRRKAVEQTAGEAQPLPSDGALASTPPAAIGGAPGALPSDAQVAALLDPWQSFFAYAEQQAKDAEGVSGRRSVLLDPSGSVSLPRRLPCQSEVSAVAIDLDAGTTPFASAAAHAASRGLADKLARLRAEKIVVLWVTSAPAGEVAQVAEALRNSGLDPAGVDPLLLVRSHGDRKQVLRWEANKDVCVIAIAGDRKGDFDELFDYLRDPAAANALDAFFGQGWFLTPPPLN